MFDFDEYSIFRYSKEIMNSNKISLAALEVAIIVTTSILATSIVGTNDILFAKWNHGSNQALSCQ